MHKHWMESITGSLSVSLFPDNDPVVGYFQFVQAVVRHHFETSNIWVEFEDLKCNLYPTQNMKITSVPYKFWMGLQVVIKIFDLCSMKK